MSTPPLILASTSNYRRELLARLRLPFTAAAPGVDETPVPHETPLARAQRLALAKARAVAEREKAATVIGSDQVAVCKGELLEKPGTTERCREQLQWLSAAAATYYTAVAVVQAERNQALQFVDTTTVYFRAAHGSRDRALHRGRAAVRLRRRIPQRGPWASACLPASSAKTRRV